MSNEGKAPKERFLRKEERQRCWDARDALWDCMKANGEDMAKCPEKRRAYEDACPPTWVTHFDRKFHYLKFKEEMNKMGTEQADENFGKKAKASS